jgi:hypothetical protein
MPISQGGKIYLYNVFQEITNRTGFVQYYGFYGINRTSSLDHEYLYKYYSTDISDYRIIYP